MKECCVSVCKPVCETVWKEVCRTEMREVCETKTKEVRRHVVEKVCQMQSVCKRVPVTECKTCCQKGCVQLGTCKACAVTPCGGCEQCKSCEPCCKPSLCQRLNDRWLSFGDCLGNIGANLGAHIVNHSHYLCGCSMVRVPDRITSQSVTHYEIVTEQVPVTKYVRHDVTIQEPRTCTKKVAVKVVERVPITETKTVATNEMKWVPTTVHRTAQGAYVDRASLNGDYGKQNEILGPHAAGCVTPNAATFEGGEGRVFVEGLQVHSAVPVTTTRMVSTCETTRVPETVTKLVLETVTRLVPTTETRIVPVTCRKTVPRLVCRMERVECTKLEPKASCQYCCCGAKKVPVCRTRQIPTTCTVRVPYTVTEMVPTTVTRRVPCSQGCGAAPCSTKCGCGSPCGLCHQPGLLDSLRGRFNNCNCGCSICDQCHTHPIRDFFAHLCRSRLCCEPCATTTCSSGSRDTHPAGGIAESYACSVEVAEVR